MPMTSKQKVARLAFWSIVIAFVVLALKVLAWKLTGSVALYSDALESIVNVIAAAGAFWAIRVSHTPADQDHPFGHHKAEYFSAVLEGVLIIVAAMLILAEVWRVWATPVTLEQPWEGLAVNGLASAINLFWAQLLIRTGRAERSPALVADGRHIMTDVVTSVGVIAGLVGAVLTGWNILDPALAVVVALNILWQGWHVIGSSVQGLMDRAVDQQEHFHIRDIISANSQGRAGGPRPEDPHRRPRHLHRVPSGRRRRHDGRRKPRHLRPHRGGAEGRYPERAGDHSCRARGRSQAAARNGRRAVRVSDRRRLRF